MLFLMLADAGRKSCPGNSFKEITAIKVYTVVARVKLRLSDFK